MGNGLEKTLPIILSAIFFFSNFISNANAHGFGQRIDLPVPLSLYLAGGALAVIISFIIVGIFVGKKSATSDYKRYNLLKHKNFANLVENNIFKFIIKLVFVSILGILIFSGFFGNKNPNLNITPVATWILFAVGMVYLSAFVGNIWMFINPWKSIYEWFEKAVNRKRLYKPIVYSLWIAFGLFFTFRWIENAFPNPANPFFLGIMLIIYSVITFAGMRYYGKHAWLRYGDPFAVFFRLLSKFSFTEVRVKSKNLCKECSSNCCNEEKDCVNCYECYEKARKEDKELNLRPFAVELSRTEKIDFSGVTFILLILSAITFDGIKATPIWYGVNAFLNLKGDIGFALLNTAGLLGFLGIFLGIYLSFSFLAKIFSKEKIETKNVAFKFILSILPIAIVYEVAHFATLLITNGQLTIPLLSDPFGYGWDLFGTVTYRINYQIINFVAFWNFQVMLIVIGHIVAVYISHIIALKLFSNSSNALRSQYPMLGLMILYTLVSLWIISLPITGVG